MPNGLFQQNQNIPWITLEKTAMTLPSRRLQMLSPEMPHLKSLPKMTTHDTKYCRYSRNWCHVKRTRPKILPWFGNEWNKKTNWIQRFKIKHVFHMGSLEGQEQSISMKACSCTSLINAFWGRMVNQLACQTCGTGTSWIISIAAFSSVDWIQTRARLEVRDRIRMTHKKVFIINWESVALKSVPPTIVKNSH